MAAMNGFHHQEEDDCQGEECELAASSIQINTKKDVEEFMRSIQLDFLHVVDPRECGLLDLMTEHDLLTDTDLESLSGKDVNIRKDQARKAWFHLRGLTPEQFKTGVLPFLCKWYPHVIPRDWTSRSSGTRHSKYCLRHDIMGKVRPVAVTDLLYKCGCLDFERYKSITEQENQSVWPSLLDVMTSQHPDDVMTKLCDGLRLLLIHYKRHVPDDLPDLLSRGLLCTCETNHVTDVAPPGAPNTNTAVNHKVQQWLQRLPRKEDAESVAGESSAGYPEEDRSSVSSDETIRPAPKTTVVNEPKKQDREADDSVKLWAETNGLKEDTVRALVQHDFTTLDDVGMMSEKDVTELYMKTSRLSGKQCVLLKKAISKASLWIYRAMTVTPRQISNVDVGTVEGENSQGETVTYCRITFISSIATTPCGRIYMTDWHNDEIRITSFETSDSVTQVILTEKPYRITVADAVESDCPLLVATHEESCCISLIETKPGNKITYIETQQCPIGIAYCKMSNTLILSHVGYEQGDEYGGAYTDDDDDDDDDDVDNPHHHLHDDDDDHDDHDDDDHDDDDHDDEHDHDDDYDGEHDDDHDGEHDDYDDDHDDNDEELTCVDVINMSNGRIVKTLVTSKTLPGLRSPRYLCVHNDELLISDYSSDCIFRVDLESGRLRDTLRHPLLEKPRQVCVDSAGNIYVASYGCKCVLVMSAAGQWRELLTGEKHGDGKYLHPVAVGVSPCGLVVSWGKPVSDYNESVVKIYTNFM